MKKVVPFIMAVLMALMTQVSVAESKEYDGPLMDIDSDHWSISLPEEWKLAEATGGIRADSPDEVYAVFISTYRIPVEMSDDEWSKNITNVAISSDADDPKFSFTYYHDKPDLQGEVRSVGIDKYDENKKFRIYAKHFRFGNMMVRLSFHDYWCESYEESLKKSEEIISRFKINT